MARLCATVAGQWASQPFLFFFFYIWPHSRNNCRTSWVRQTNWGLGMSYAACAAYAAHQSIHLVCTSPVSMLIYERRRCLSSTMQQMAHFMGHKTSGDGGCMGYHVGENKQSGILWWRHPPRTWLNPDELAPQWDILLPLWRESWWLRPFILKSQVSGLLNSQAPCPPVLRNL